MRISVLSDGTRAGTRVYEDNRDVTSRFAGITWKLLPGSDQAVVTLLDVSGYEYTLGVGRSELGAFVPEDDRPTDPSLPIPSYDRFVDRPTCKACRGDGRMKSETGHPIACRACYGRGR